MKVRLWVYLTMFVFACMGSGELTKDTNYYSAHSHEFIPPPPYVEWWAEMEECSGRTADMSKVKFLDFDTTVTAVPLDEFNGEALAWWTMFRNSITFVGRNKEMESVVKHEMLHAILNRSGHPKEFFEKRCKV